MDVRTGPLPLCPLGDYSCYKDLLELYTIYAEFQKGNIVAHTFSSLANDQVHERLNAIVKGGVKGDGGIVGITDSESALNRWTVGGPDKTIK